MTSESQHGGIAVEGIARTIFVLRGHRVILDSDLAAICGVETRTLNQAVKRNSARFQKTFVSNSLILKSYLQDHNL